MEAEMSDHDNLRIQKRALRLKCIKDGQLRNWARPSTINDKKSIKKKSKQSCRGKHRKKAIEQSLEED